MGGRLQSVAFGSEWTFSRFWTLVCARDGSDQGGKLSKRRNIARSLVGSEQHVDLKLKWFQSGLHDVPDQGVIDLGIAVDQDVAKSDDLAVVIDFSSNDGSRFPSCASALPMISNWRSTAARNIALR